MGKSGNEKFGKKNKQQTIKSPGNKVATPRKSNTHESKINGNNTQSSDDYINSLVRMIGTNDKLVDETSKAKRIEKRKAKKMERELRIQQKRKLNERKNNARNLPIKSKRRSQHSITPSILKEKFQILAEMLIEVVKKYNQSRTISRGNNDSSLLTDLISKRFHKVKTNIDSIQPRKSSYGGIGFARDSYYISLDDPSFIAKLEEEFAEHIDGFFGKQRTKAMKKQLDKDMLWKRLMKEKMVGKKPTSENETYVTATTSFAASNLKVNAIIDQGTSLM